MHNNIVCPFTLPVEVARDKVGRAGFSEEALRTSVAMCDLSKSTRTKRKESLSEYENRAATSLELYFRRMLSRCALRVHTPYNSGQNVPSPRQIKMVLAPTIKKTVRFVDRYDRYWNAVVAYLRPISRSLQNDQRDWPLAWDSCLAWNLYLLILATKYESEVVLPPRETLDIIAKIGTTGNLDAEAKARLSVVSGLFGSFTRAVEGHILRLLPNIPSFALSERIEEILEDAYLLEASHLRRLLGIKEKVTSIKRHLRLLLSFIQRKRSWAKGIVSIGSDVVLGGKTSFGLLETLIELVPDLGSGRHYPVLAVKDDRIVFEKESCFQFIRSIQGETLIRLDPYANRVTKKLRRSQAPCS
jgi:hypothetical protein